MTKRWGVNVMAVTLLAAGGVACGDPPTAQGQLAVGEHTVTVETVTARSGAEVSVEFWRLGVPESRAAGESNAIEIAFARLRSTAAEPARPVFYLAGGPGDAAVFQAREPAWLDYWVPFLALGDVVLVDQRGTGESTPRLRWRTAELPSLDVFADQTLLFEHLTRMTHEAKADLESRGVDLEGYNTIESADDLDAIRGVLGYQSVAVLGFSYGTHLSIAYARRHGERLDAMILSNVEGPDHTKKLPVDLTTQLRRLSVAVAEDPEVGPMVPNLMELVMRVRERLDREPMVVTVHGPEGIGPLQIPVGQFFFDLILRMDVGDASDLPVFPRLLHSIDQGDPTLLTWFVQKRAGMVLGVNVAHELIDVASGVSPGRLELIKSQAAASPFGDVSNPIPIEVEAIWGQRDLGDAFRSPLVSDVPTLLLSGEWDWNTPPYQAEEVAWGLTRATHLKVAGAGHEQVMYHPDIVRAMLGFLRGDDVSGIRADRGPLRFVPLDRYDPDNTHPSVPAPGS